MSARPIIVFRSSRLSPHSSRGRHGLTLVELLIVISIIAVLVGAVLVGGSGLIHRSRDNNTAAVLQLVNEAVEQFKRDETAAPKISSVTQAKSGSAGFANKDRVAYLDRYDRYPPDELEVFTARGLPGAGTGARSLAPGGATVHSNPAPPWGPMKHVLYPPDPTSVENREQLAMITAIELYSEAGSAILDRIPDKNRGSGRLDDQGVPVVFLDRPGGEADRFDQSDLQLQLILDDWGNPISYLSQRDHELAANYEEIESRNRGSGWNEASTELIRMNGGTPVIFSYGDNGKDQLTSTEMGTDAKASLVGDFEEEAPQRDHVIDNPLNDDNVYANPQLKEKLAKGLLTP